jgi:hypothetical protein
MLMMIEWIASGFEDFPAWGDIWDVSRMIDEIMRLKENISNLIKAAQDYIKGFWQAVEAVKSIPQIESVRDVTATTGEFRKGAGQMRKARVDFDKHAGSLEKQLDDMSAQEPK